MPGTPRTWAILLALAALAGLVFTGTSTYDFAQYLDRQVHGLHCSFLPGLGSVDVTGASGCHVTLMSPYSSVFRQALWGGIPISLLGMGTFSLLLYRALDLLIRGPSRAALQATVFLSIVPVVASIVMGTIAFQVLDAACKLCIGTYVASGFTFLAAVAALVSYGRPAAAADEDDEGHREPSVRFSDEPRPPRAARAREVEAGEEVRASTPVALGIALVQLGLFCLLPVAAWAAMAPQHQDYIGTCGELTDASDRYEVLIPMGPQGSGTPAVEVLDPLCPSCRGFEERLSASGQGAMLSRKLLLFPLDSSCNWMVSSSLHPGACTVSEAMLCAGDRAGAVLEWAFEHQEEIRTATAEDPEAAARMVAAAFPDLAGCVGKPAVRSRLNQSLRWAVKNQLPVLTPQLFVDGRRVCDADTDLGLDYTLGRMLSAEPAATTTEGTP